MDALQKRKCEVERLRDVVREFESRLDGNVTSFIEIGKTEGTEQRRGWILEKAQRTHDTLFSMLKMLRGW